MGEKRPDGAVSVAQVPLPTSFPTLTIYTPTEDSGKDYKTLTTLHYGTGKDDWTLISQSTDVQVTADKSTNTAHLWWDPVGQALGWDVRDSSGSTTFTTASVQITANPAQPTGVSSASSAEVTTAPDSGSRLPNPSTISEAPTTAPRIPTSSPPGTVSSPSAVSSSSAQKNGLSGGAVAGVAIGGLFAGALIAGLLAWFRFKRKKPSGHVRDSEASNIALMHQEKGSVAKTRSLSSRSPMFSALENGLPQPLEDKMISGEISKISNLIKNHVQSYYHTRAVSPGLIDYNNLQALGDNLPLSVGTLSTLLNNSATREIALRFCLAWVVTSRTQLDSPNNATFLPPEVSGCIQSIIHADQGSRMRSLFYTRWRALTAELLQSAYVRKPFTAVDGRIQNIQTAASILDEVLRPFADSRIEDGARKHNLEEILKRSAQFAFTLFSQPTTWDFDWQSEQGVKSGSLCLFPALVQVTDEHGEPVNPPRPFSDAVHRRLDE